MQRRLALRIDVLELVEVGHAVREPVVGVEVARAHGRGTQTGDHRRRDPLVGTVRRQRPVEMEAEVVQLRAGLPGQSHRPVPGGGLEVHQLDHRRHLGQAGEADVGAAIVRALEGARGGGVGGRVGRAHDAAQVADHVDTVAGITGGTAQVGGEGERRAHRVQTADEDVAAAGVGRLQGGHGREIGGKGVPGEADAAGPVRRDAKGSVVAATPQVGGVDEGGRSRQRRVELRHEGVHSAVRRRVEGAGGGGERIGSGLSGDVRLAAAIERDAAPDVVAGAPQVRGIGCRRAAGVHDRDEGIAGAVVGRIEGAGRGREVVRRGQAGDVGDAAGGDLDAVARVVGGPAEEEIPDEPPPPAGLNLTTYASNPPEPPGVVVRPVR